MKSINSKQKGNRFERAVAELLRIYGWEARTARETDKLLDDAGVDISTNAPFNIQCKHQERLQPGLHKLLDNMPADKPPVVFHKRNNQGTIVAMRLPDFCALLLQNGNITQELPGLNNVPE